MIRVLQVVTHMNRGGLETMLMNYFRNIDRSKVQFDFLVHRPYRADYDDEIEQLGGCIYRIDPLNPFSRSYRAQLYNFFKEHPEYKIVHVHQDCLSSVILKEAQRAGVPVRIAHSHNSNQDKNLKYLIKLWYRRSIPQYATRLMSCGEEAGQWMFRGREFEILHNAIDAAQYRFNEQTRKEMRRQLDIAEDEFVIGHVGSFTEQKNHKFILDIFQSVIGKKKARLLLVGDGTLRPVIEQSCKENGISSQVIMTGVRNDIPCLLQAMDALLFPSLYEGVPLSLVEAQAAGLPCVISDVIPNEVVITENVIKLPLSAGPQVWTSEILKTEKLVRMDTYKQISKSGYDIKENAAKLENIYLNMARE